MKSTNQVSNPEKSSLAQTDAERVKKVGESAPERPMATIDNDDERLLARIGYRQVCDVSGHALNCPKLGTGAQTRIHKVVNRLVCHINSRCPRFCSCHSWQSSGFWRARHCSMGLVYWISDGNVYCKLRFVYSCLKRRMVSLTIVVAELVSAYPTAGGMYFVTKHVVPKEHVAIWAWIIGWCNFLGQAAGVASLAYTIAQMILAAAVMNSTLLEDGTYSFKPYVASRLD
jgi:hypothetical protein